MESINHIRQSADQISRKSKALLAYTIFTAAVTLLASEANAQTFAEWFSQKKTQKKYLLQQIAALQVYSTYVRQGYNIAHNGLGSVTGSLLDEFSLHTTYYNKLKAVNPVVKNDPQVNEILVWQKDILTRMAEWEQINLLTGDEKKCLAKVKLALLNDCNQNITALQNLVSDGKLQMSDAERLTRLGKIHKAMQDNFRFASSFTTQVQLYAVQKHQESENVRGSKHLYGIR